MHVRMIATRRYIGSEGHVKAGQVLLVPEYRAKQLRDQGLATDEDGPQLKKPCLPVSGPAQPSASSQAAPALPLPTSISCAAEDGAQSRSTTHIASPLGATSSTPATGGGGTPIKRGRGRPPKVRD